MFLLNSRLGLFSAASFEAPLLPKLRGHFAEFLNNGSPVRLRILSSPTCVGLRYGHLYNCQQLFSPAWIHMLPYLSSVLHKIRLMLSVLHYSTASLTPQALPSTCSCYPSVSLLRSYRWYWNLNQLSIAYDYRPRLRSRLTLGG